MDRSGLAACDMDVSLSRAPLRGSSRIRASLDPNVLALLTPGEMGRADAAAMAGGMAGDTLMEAAGRAVARAVVKRFRATRTLVLAGPGNNGGDGYVVARSLEQAGWPVAVAALAPPTPGTDAAHAAARWKGPMVPFSVAEAQRAGLVIDAVFGAGLSRDVDGVVAEALQAVRAPIVAVDVPSGVDGATGSVRGFAPQAATTITFFRLKPGHLLLPGRTLCGETVCAEIGIPATVLDDVAPRCWRNAPGLWRLPEAASADHKYTRGHVTILGGEAMTGAARLAAGAARRAGAGLVTIAAPDHAFAQVYRQGDPGVIVAEAGSDAALGALLADARRVAWVAGPGLAPDARTRMLLGRLLGEGRQVVVDAGALMACAGTPRALAGAAVLTPHEGEFTRLFGPVLDDRLGAARAAAASVGAVVLLKGPDTVIAAPDGRAAINDNAPPSLATGGSGDVLAGIVAALLAQGLQPFDAACAGTWLHGAAAGAGRGLIAEDLLDGIAATLRG